MRISMFGPLAEKARAYDNARAREHNKKVPAAQNAFTTAAVFGMLEKRISSYPNKDSLTVEDQKNKTTTTGQGAEIVLPKDLGLLIGSFLSRQEACSVVLTCKTANIFARNARLQVLGNTNQDREYLYQFNPLSL